MRGLVQLGALALGLALAPVCASAGEVMATNVGGVFGVPVVSMKEMRTRSVVQQEYDFSCGAAAVATLLTHHYGDPTPEQAVFRSMYEKGDKQVIETQGFSMLDMKRYLDRQGYHSDGFRLKMDRLRKIGVPVITLINISGYFHFVVVKGIDDRRVLVGDPAFGTNVLDRELFEQIWSGTALAIRDRPQEARKEFNKAEDWSVRPPAPIGNYNFGPNGISDMTLHLPQPGDL